MAEMPCFCHSIVTNLPSLTDNITPLPLDTPAQLISLRNNWKRCGTMVSNSSELPQEVSRVASAADAGNKNLAVNLQTPAVEKSTATPGYHLPATIITGLPEARPHPTIEMIKPVPTPHPPTEVIKPDAKMHSGDEGVKSEAKLKTGDDGDKSKTKLDLKKDDEINSEVAKPPKKDDKDASHDPKKPDDDHSDKGDHGKAPAKLHDAIKEK